MTVTFQKKIEEYEFIKIHWNILITEIENDIRKHKNSAKKSLICSSFVYLILWFLIVGLMYASKALNIRNILLGFIVYTLFFCSFIFTEMIDFPSDFKWLNKAKREKEQFLYFNIEENKIQEIYKLLTSNNTFNSKNYEIEERLLNQLYIFDKLCNFKIVEVSYSKATNVLEKIKYIDEDGIIYQINLYIPLKKSLTLKENDFLIQMTENGLQFVMPTDKI